MSTKDAVERQFRILFIFIRNNEITKFTKNLRNPFRSFRIFANRYSGQIALRISKTAE